MRVSQIPEISQISANFFFDNPNDLYGREAPPPRFAGQQKACFPQWVADRRLFVCRKGNDSRTAYRAKGPHGHPGAKARNARTRVVMSEIASAADQYGVQEG
jgi:hypothetical protein